jgi:diguanylate cyclase (GGDEF)-like protein
MLDRFLRNPPAPVIVFATAGMLAATAIVDQLAAREVGLHAFYLVVVALAAWFLERAWAFGYAVLGSGLWLLLDLIGSPAMWDPLVSAWNGLSLLLVLAFSAFVVGELREAMRRGRALARVDELTGVGNSTMFYDAARREIERSRRNGSVITVAYFDVDGFDRVVASQGAGSADRLLKVVASSMSDVIRSTDLLARLHDDEFGALFPDTDRVAAGAVLLKVSEQVLEALKESSWDAALRMGAVTFVEPPKSVNDMRRAMEDVLHDARQGGRNVVEHRVFGAN